MLRALPPKGGGAETPGRVANSGRTRFNARSCISPTERVSLEKTRLPTGTLPASKRMMKGGTVPGGHERAGPVHVGHRFRHRLGHVSAGIGLEFDDRRALDGLGFDVLDAGDVEEMILVVIGEITFHLGRVHSAVRLRHVNRGNAQAREY